MAEVFLFPWEDAACRGDPLPEGLSLPDQMGYLALRNIYRDFFAGRLSTEAAHSEKTMLRKAYEEAQHTVKFQDKLCTHHVAVMQATEAAQNRYRKEHTLEAADALSAALDGRIFRPDQEVV